MADLSAASDHCCRTWVFEAARLVVGDNHLLDILESMYGKTVAWLRGQTAKFACSCGVRQGGNESPMLYCCFSKKCLDDFEERCRFDGLDDFVVPFDIPPSASDSGKRVRGTATVNYLAYADDICVFHRDRRPDGDISRG